MIFVVCALVSLTSIALGLSFIHPGPARTRHGWIRETTKPAPGSRPAGPPAPPTQKDPTC